MPNLIGQSLGRYHILEEAGKGGMAIVYRAYDTLLERDVAVKVIRVDQFAPAALERILKRFTGEAKVVASLAHTNIVGVIDFGEYEGSPYMVMPYLPGGTLNQHLGQPIPWQEAVKLLLPITEALGYAHSRNIIHRDVKPSNILFTQSGQPMLTDFGIAKILKNEETQNLTGTGVGIGTPEYMSPEQGQGLEINVRSDIYSLGVVLYELITGRKPFTATTPMAVVIKHIHDPLPRPRLFVPDLPERVEKVLLKALAKEPENRYPDMGAFATAVESLLVSPSQNTERTLEQPTEESTQDAFEPPGGNIPVAKPGQRSHGQTARLKRLLPLAGLGGLACIVIIAGLVYLWFKSHNLPTSVLAPTQATVLTAAPIVPPTTEPSVTSTPFPTQKSLRISPLDGMELVLVPAGEFLIGVTPADEDRLYSNCPRCDQTSFHDAPQRSIHLDEYWIDKTEVTVAQFAKFVNDTGTVTAAEKQGLSWVFNPSINDLTQRSGRDWLHPQGELISIGEYGQHPVVHVSWDDANAYCVWAGRRLPSEAEWEKAARGTDGRLFPWGNNLPTTQLANINALNNTLPVGSCPDGASPYGALDMTGNVWEWTSSYYQNDYYTVMPGSNPPGPASGTNRIVRGGSWGSFVNIELVYLSSAFRFSDSPGYSSDLLGFRCASETAP